jgi:nicotinate-nucleotide pyrophosphorylase (carboxylating)
LERYAVELGGGHNSRFGLDDGVVVTANHISILGGVSSAVRQAKEQLGYLHKISVHASSEGEAKEAIDAGADILVLQDLSVEEVGRLTTQAKELRDSILVECSGAINLENVRRFADAGVDLICIESLTNSAPATNVSFRVQQF